MFYLFNCAVLAGFHLFGSLFLERMLYQIYQNTCCYFNKVCPNRSYCGKDG